MGERVLVVTTSQPHDPGAGRAGGARVAQVLRFVEAMEARGHSCTIACPAGGAIPLDARGERGCERFLADPARRAQLERAAKLEGLELGSFAGLCVAGGRGALWDLPDSQALAHAVRSVWDAAGVVGALAEGLAGLMNVRLHDGGWLVCGRGVTAPTRLEERLAGGRSQLPFSLEAELRRRGARYRSAVFPCASFVHVDGQLVCGQNAASSAAFGQAFARLLGDRAAGWANAPGRKHRSAAAAAARGALEPRA